MGPALPQLADSHRFAALMISATEAGTRASGHHEYHTVVDICCLASCLSKDKGTLRKRWGKCVRCPGENMEDVGAE